MGSNEFRGCGVRIYLIRNTVTGQGYVGQTVQSLRQRWFGHVCDSRHRAFAPIQFAMRKYGQDAFVISELEAAASRDELDRLEIEWIARLGTHVRSGGYNVTTGGRGGRGVYVRDETRAKISAKAKGRARSPEASARQAETMRKRGLSPEHRAKLFSPETIRRRVEAARANRALNPKVKPDRPPLYPHSRAEWLAKEAARMADLCGPEHRSGDNLFISKRGRKECRACNRAARKRRREKQSLNFKPQGNAA